MHIPVLSKEVIEHLAIQPNDVVLDGTVGGGGHSVRIAELLGPEGVLIGLDLDSEALHTTEEALKGARCTVHLRQKNFRNLESVLHELGIENMDKMLLDLGFSSNQIEHSGRGFSFRANEPLLMTLSDKPGKDDLTAQEILNNWDAENIESIIAGYGEERFAKRIAQAIVERRALHPFKTTGQLVAVIHDVVPLRYQRGKIHPATKTFQALRIAVNDEFNALKEALSKGFMNMAQGGRIAVISFHSGEDRIVKNFFRDKQRLGELTEISKKPIVPSEEEQKENIRSRSAKLRVAQKT